MSQIAEILTACLLVLGGLFGLIGSFGLLRLKQPMQRLHAPTKATTIGTGTALLAVAVHLWLVEDRLALREVLVALFFFVTAPLSAMFLARAHMFLTLKREDLPPPLTGKDWACLSPDPAPDMQEQAPAKT